MQLFIGFHYHPDGSFSVKETMANNRYSASLKLGVPMNHVQLQTRKH